MFKQSRGERSHRLVSALGAGLVLATLGLVPAGPAAAFNPTPEPPKVMPLDGAHWQAGAGFPDPTGQSALGLVQDAPLAADTHMPVAEIQHVPGSVTELGFASQVPNGINPCWMVGITNPDGSTSTLHLTTDSAQIVSEGPPPPGDVAPYIQWSWSITLPPGAVVTSARAEVMSGQQPPPGNDRVAFDRFSVNGDLIATP
jgi:hypothetical protein